jgi:acyl-coenzyme A thioesterase PaaI-like protein
VNKEIFRQKFDRVAEWFNSHYFARQFGIMLDYDYIDVDSIVAGMPIRLEQCTGGKIVTGGIYAVLGNAAGVSLAMIYSEHFTPLAEIKNLKFYKPIVFGKDKILLARAKLFKIEKNRIIIKVEIFCEDNQTRAEGIFEYAILSEDYKTD